MRTDIKTILKTAVVSFVVLLSTAMPVYAQTYNSSNYQVDEVFLGSGGTNDASSATLKGRASIGDLGVGESGSTSYLAFGGFTTTAAPELELDVDVTNVDLGVLSPSTTAYTSAKFRVRTYLASNYAIYTSGPPPTSEGGAIIPGLTSGGPAAINTRQFGINLTANTTPAVGAVPSQLPSGAFSFGTVASNYNIPDTFRYNDGETIAQSSSSSGVTEYTISYIFNINGTTAAGNYVFRQSIVATSTF